MAGRGTPADQGGSRAEVARRDESGRWVKGTSGNPAGKPRGTVHLSTRLRQALLTPVGDDGKVAADVLVSRLAAAVLKDPTRHWRILEWIEERELGRTPQPLVLGQATDEDRAVPTDRALAQQLDAYLARLEPGRRREVVGVLVELHAHVPGIVMLPHGAAEPADTSGPGQGGPAGGAGGDAAGEDAAGGGAGG